LCVLLEGECPQRTTVLGVHEHLPRYGLEEHGERSLHALYLRSDLVAARRFVNLRRVREPGPVQTGLLRHYASGASPRVRTYGALPALRSSSSCASTCSMSPSIVTPFAASDSTNA